MNLHSRETFIFDRSMHLYCASDKIACIFGQRNICNDVYEKFNRIILYYKKTFWVSVFGQLYLQVSVLAQNCNFGASLLLMLSGPF